MKKISTLIVILAAAIQTYAQVISSTAGIVMNITNSAVVSSGSISNSGTISNAGILNLSANYLNANTSNGNGTYNIAGNWTNNGTFTRGTSTVNFNGSSLQTLSGSVPSAFYNVTVNGAGITLSQNASFAKVLTLTSGTIGGSDTMTLLSNAAGTARIAQVGAGVTQSSVTAMFTVQRYESSRTKANYASLSSPVLSTTIGDWNINNRNPKFYMSGIGGPDGSSGSYVSVKRYAETTNTYNNITSYTSPGINYVIRQGEGIYLWEGTSLSAMVNPFSFNAHGTPTIGNVSIGVTNTTGKGAGFNIIGNPYASPIDWSSFLASNITLQTSFYIFEQDGTWHVFTSGSIPMEQGFGVVTTSTATINFQEIHKTIVDASLLREVNPSDEPNTATFLLSNDSNDFSCPTIISFDPSFVKEYSPAEDAYFIESYVEEVPKLFTISDDDKHLMLNKLPDVDSTMDVPLTTIAGVAGATYSLEAQNLNKLTSYNCVSLIDKNTNSVLNNFMDNSTYKFNTESGSSQKDFVLRFTRLAAGQNCDGTSTRSDNIQIYSTQKNIVVNFYLNQTEDVVISMYNMLGQKLCPDALRTIQTGKFEMPVPVTDGVYVVRVQSAYGVTTKKIGVNW
jgi:hypothetical protein